MEKTIPAMTARQQFGQILEETFYRGNQYVVERAGRPMAAIVPIEQYRQWQQRRADFFALVDQAQERTRQVPPDELEAVIGEAVAAAKAAERLPERSA